MSKSRRWTDNRETTRYPRPTGRSEWDEVDDQEDLEEGEPDWGDDDEDWDDDDDDDDDWDDDDDRD